jgi:hypothetical protein
MPLIQTWIWILAMLLISFSLIIGAICFVDVVMVAVSTHHLTSLGVFFFSSLLLAYHRVLLLPFPFQLCIHNVFCLPVGFILCSSSLFPFSFFFFFFFFCGQWHPGVYGTDGLDFSNSAPFFFLCCFQFRLAAMMVCLAAIGDGAFGQ